MQHFPRDVPILITSPNNKQNGFVPIFRNDYSGLMVSCVKWKCPSLLLVMLFLLYLSQTFQKDIIECGWKVSEPVCVPQESAGFCSALMPFKHSCMCFMRNIDQKVPIFHNQGEVSFNVMKVHTVSDQSSCWENCFPTTEWTKAWLVLREFGCVRY